jgi:tetratricopeptide (TPR) repeat protein
VNAHLALNVQKAMKKHKVAFCMAVDDKGYKRCIYINRRSGNSFSIIVLEENTLSPEELASRYFCDIADKAMKNDNYSNAILAASQAVKYGPDNHHAWFSRSMAYYGKGDYELALKDINAAIDRSVDRPDHFIIRANIHKAMRKDDLARKDMDKAYALDPKWTERYLLDRE